MASKRKAAPAAKDHKDDTRQSRFRVTELAMWADRNFMALSRPQPNAQTIWQFLLTGPYTTALPGIVVCKPLAIAVHYDWLQPEGFLEAFVEAFSEITAKGMAKVDAEAGLIWLPGAARPHRAAKPASPNVVRGWRRHWIDVPECSLKEQAIRELRSFVGTLGPTYAAAFEEAFPKDSPKQEQEQEQEQEQDTSPLKPPGGGPETGAAAQPDPPLNSANRVLLALNDRAGRKLPITSPEVLKPIVQRLRGEEGEAAATPEQLELVIDHRCALWLGTEQEQYLRPKTIFARKHWADYLDAAQRWDEQGRPRPKSKQLAKGSGLVDVDDWMES